MKLSNRKLLTTFAMFVFIFACGYLINDDFTLLIVLAFYLGLLVGFITNYDFVISYSMQYFKS